MGKPKIEGEIGCFGIADWWLKEFTEKDRAYIEQKYKPMSAETGGGNSRKKPPTEGNILSTTQTTGMFLSGLSSWFTSSPEDRALARRILEKAVKVIDPKKDIFGLHFTY